MIARESDKPDHLEVRTLKPSEFGSGGLNSQHSKTWIVDDAIYVDGSANFTGQSTRNLESILVTRESQALGTPARRSTPPGRSRKR